MLTVWLIIILICFLFRHKINVESIYALIPDASLTSALVLLLLFAAKSLSVVFYSGILYAVSGLIFPLPLALLINVAGSVIMISIPYCIGKKAGSGLLSGLIEKNPKLALLRDIQNESQILSCALARLVHVLPSDPVSMYFGASGVSPLLHIIGSLIGLAPMYVCFTFMGISLDDPTSPLFIISVAAQIIFILLSLPLYRYIYKRKKQGGKAE